MVAVRAVDLRARGLDRLSGVAARSWERLVLEAGAPAERHPTGGDPGWGPAEPPSADVWVPDWAAAVAQLWPYDPDHARAFLVPALRTLAADPALRAALAAERALGGTGAEAGGGGRPG